MRRFNYTGRKRLGQGHVNVLLHTRSTDLEFDLDLDLSDLRKEKSVPGDAAIHVEAYTRTKWERFQFGTVAHPDTGSRRKLSSFTDKDNIQFRVKVVDTDSGRILAMQSQIRPAGKGESRSRSLLPVEVRPLDNLVYSVDFPEDSPPVLVLNEKLDSVSDEGIKALANRPIFVALALPQVVREILLRLMVIDPITDDFDDTSDCEQWQKGWLALARTWNESPLPGRVEEDPEPMLQWIDEAVDGMAHGIGVLQQFQQGD